MRKSMMSLLGMLALTSLGGGCNALIGIEELELEPPVDAPAATCNVAARFGLISSNPSTSTLTRRSSDNGPTLTFLLNTDSKPDVLSLPLYANMGGHGVLEAPGTYALTTGDAKLETCGICALVYTDYDRTTSRFLETFMARAEGTFTVTAATSTRLAGRIQRLRFRRVDLSGGATRELDDPCSVIIDDVVFDMTYQ